jgi:DNA repair exonuclease SbcCD ATPase subunit
MKKLGILIAVVLFGIFAFAQEVDMETLLNRIELLEEYTNMIYDVLGTKVSSDDFETVLAELDGRISDLQEQIAGLNEILTGLAAQIGDTDYLLRKAIENAQKDLQAKIDTKADSSALENAVKDLQAKIDTKADSELETKVLNIQSTIDTGLPALRDMLYELSANLAAVEERLTSYIEVSLLTIKDEAKAEVMDEILPMLDDIKVTLDIHDSDILKIYDTLGTLSEQIAGVQEKLASFEEISASIELLTLKLDMHDQDIVNIYDNLSMKADREQVDALEASVADALENAKKDLQAKIDTKADAKAVEEKVNIVNMIAWIGVVLGAVALVLPFVRGQ